MKLSDALTADRIELNVFGTDKYSVIEEMLAVMNRSVALPDPDLLLRMILEQEEVKSSGVDAGVAIPHTRSDRIEGVVAALGISREGVDFQSFDGHPAYLIVLILSSEAAMPAYMSVLSRTARIFDRETMRQRVIEANSAEGIIELIRSQEVV